MWCLFTAEIFLESNNHNDTSYYYVIVSNCQCLCMFVCLYVSVSLSVYQFVGVYSGSHDVVMSFYRVYNHIQPPSGIATGCDYMLFKVYYSGFDTCVCLICCSAVAIWDTEMFIRVFYSRLNS